MIDRLKDNMSRYSFLIPSLVALGLVAVFPVIYAVRSSFYSWNLHRPAAREFVGFNNFVKLVTDYTYVNSVSITLLYTAITVGSTMILGFLLALLLKKPFKGRNVVRALLTVPMIMTQVVIGLNWRVFMWEPDYGLINWLLRLVGIRGPAWVSSVPFAFIAAAITNIWFMTPLVMIIMDASLASFPQSLEDAAKIDGASYWQRIIYVIIPILKRTFAFTLLLRITIDFRMFDIVHVLTGGGPARTTQLLSIWVYNQALRVSDMGYSNAGAILMMVIISIICSIIAYFGLIRGGEQA